MTDWARAANPSAPITTEAEARDAARASAIAIFIGVIWGLVGVAVMLTSGAEAMRVAAAEAAAAAGPEVAGMAEMAPQIALWTAILLVVVQLVLGVVQWKRPGVIIPIVFGILTAYGLVTTLLGLANGGAAPAGAETWQVWVGVIVMAIQLVLHIAGVRGANKLDKLRGPMG